jgi:hypothetical protein
MNLTRGQVAVAAALGLLVLMAVLIARAGMFSLWLYFLLLPVAICVVLAAGAVWWCDRFGKNR